MARTRSYKKKRYTRKRVYKKRKRTYAKKRKARRTHFANSVPRSQIYHFKDVQTTLLGLNPQLLIPSLTYSCGSLVELSPLRTPSSYSVIDGFHNISMKYTKYKVLGSKTTIKVGHNFTQTLRNAGAATAGIAGNTINVQVGCLVDQIGPYAKGVDIPPLASGFWDRNRLMPTSRYRLLNAHTNYTINAAGYLFPTTFR